MLETPGERLRWARKRAGFASANDAARRFAWNETTYKAHENGTRGIRHDPAVRYGHAFKIDPGWLMTGTGNPPAEVAVTPAHDDDRPLTEEEDLLLNAIIGVEELIEEFGTHPPADVKARGIVEVYRLLKGDRAKKRPGSSTAKIVRLVRKLA